MARLPRDSRSSHGIRWRGLIPQLFVIIILPLTILLLAIPFGSLTLHQQAMRILVGERDERTARSVARALNEQLNHRAASVQSIALRALDTVSPSSILSASDYLLPDFDGGLAIFAPDGSLQAATGTRRGLNGVGLTDVLRRAGNLPIFSTPLLDSTTGEYWVLVAVTGERDSIAVGAFSATALIRRTLADAFSVSDQTSAVVLDGNDQPLYLAGPLPLSKHVTDHPGIAEALRGESGTTFVQTADSGEHVVAFSSVAPVGWALVIEERWELVDNPLLRTTQFAPLALIPPLLLAIVALLFGIRQIVRPLQTLESRAADLAWGRFDAIEKPVGGIAEIRRLQAELIHMAHKVKLLQESLRDYISAITAGQEEERRRLARELHDDTLQALIALNQRTQLARLSIGDSPAAASLAEIQTLTEQTMANLRRLTRALRPIYLEDLGLATALEMLAREASQSIQVPIEFHRIGSERRFKSEVELALYRMAQEALNNVARHAQASNGSVTISFAPETVTMVIADDGHGFRMPETPAEFAPKGHFGLLGLHERAELIGANLDIRSALGQGTQVTIRLPTSAIHSTST